MTYAAIFEKGRTSWGAYIPDLPGVIAAAETREEAEKLLCEAAQLQLHALREDGQPVPEPSSVAANIEIP